jgi:hypothetical protein
VPSAVIAFADDFDDANPFRPPDEEVDFFFFVFALAMNSADVVDGTFVHDDATPDVGWTKA